MDWEDEYVYSASDDLAVCWNYKTTEISPEDDAYLFRGLYTDILSLLFDESLWSGTDDPLRIKLAETLEKWTPEV